MRQYVLGPWVWDDSDPSEPFYRAPEGTVGLVDLRPVAPTLAMGFFALSDDRDLGSDYDDFGDGVNRLEDVSLSPSQRALWSSALGIGAIAGGTLLDALWETLTLHADPDGGAVCKPLMPTHRGQMELHLGGHSLIRSQRFTGVDDPAYNRVQALIQRDYRKIRTNGHEEAGLLRALRESPRPQPNTPQWSLWMQVDALKRRLGVDFNTARDWLAAEREVIHSKYLECMRRKTRIPWQNLIPNDLPPEPPRRPTTTITESFNTADSDTLGPDLSWSELAGNTNIVSNQAESVTAGGNFCRADSDLSSSDHYAQVDITTLGTGGAVGSACRKDSTATLTYYHHRLSSTTAQLYKVVSGSFTLLDSAAVSPSIPDTILVRSSGSSISGDFQGSGVTSATDTAISSNVRCGFRAFVSGANVCDVDNFQAADLVAASSIPVFMHHYKRLRGAS